MNTTGQTFLCYLLAPLVLVAAGDRAWAIRACADCDDGTSAVVNILQSCEEIEVLICGDANVVAGTFVCPCHATFDGRTPAEEDVCDELTGAAYGLCVAYCEAQDCDQRPGRKSCDRLRANFLKLTGNDKFPCDPRCGDGNVDPGEECDRGLCPDGQRCRDDCTCPEPRLDCPCGELCENDAGADGICDDPNEDGSCECIVRPENPDPECAGQTCATFTDCNPDSDCIQPVCGSTAEGGGLCIEGATSCAGLLDCVTSADCPDGGLCFVNSCCVRAVCVPVSLFCPE